MGVRMSTPSTKHSKNIPSGKEIKMTNLFDQIERNRKPKEKRMEFYWLMAKGLVAAMIFSVFLWLIDAALLHLKG